MKDKLCVALDVDDRRRAVELVSTLRDAVGLFKVGSQLFTSEGPDLVREIQAVGGRVFLDLKFHDIPNTVARATEAAAKLGVFMLNVHASGGLAMLRAAVEASRRGAGEAGLEPPLVLGVTVLTSLSEEELKSELNVAVPVETQVRHLAYLCQSAGLDGVIASPQELLGIRAACGRDFLIVTPGIRPVGAERGDQARITTPKEAIRMGADYIVVGRPIIAAADPVQAAIEVVRDMSNTP
ncbi:MAG: orotidine-5'-phosphate decarboxylase [Candidatus Andersenbacteria bacterium]|nr:orotidine-5'-phosphate decarboxylase [Candidatus Andersenbacteria bacterium]